MNANIQFYEGEANAVSVALTDSEGAALSLTGLDISYRVVDPSSQVEVLAFSIGSGITVDDEAGGLLTLSFSATDTTQAPAQYPHELRLSGVDYAETVMSGFLTISDSVFVGV